MQLRRLEVGAHRALDVAHSRVRQQHVELPAAALTHQAEHSSWYARGHRDEVRVGELIERRKAVHASGDAFDDVGVVSLEPRR